MRNRPHHRTAGVSKQAATLRSARRRHVLGAATGAALVTAGILAVTIARGGGTPAGSGGLAPPGERNAMGMPYVATPGSAAGRAVAAGVEVTGADLDLGRVPLNVAVRPTWTLRNTGTTGVALGEPNAEVRQGCCPGPLTLGTRVLAPGASTTLTFELSMHPGMGGPHDLGVRVPVQRGGDTAHLTLGVIGDFR